MKITRSQLRKIIREELLREALNPEDVDWQRLRTMRPGDVYDLPPEQQSLAQTMISTRDRAGRKVGAARAEAPGPKIFETIDSLRYSPNYDDWKQTSREIIMSCDEFVRPTIVELVDEINRNLMYFAEIVGYKHPLSRYQSRPPKEAWLGTYWSPAKDWTFREIMSGSTVMNYSQKTGKNLFADAGALRTDIENEAQWAYDAWKKKKDEAAG